VIWWEPAVRPEPPVRNRLAAFVAGTTAAGGVVVQPRMGFADPARMRAGLRAVRQCPAPTAGTVTLDSYTRLNQHGLARQAVRQGADLNGYPIVAHGDEVNRRMLDGLAGPGFPVQMRHGSPVPGEAFAAMCRAGIDATEGGPVSYCLPYSRVPLHRSVEAWTEAVSRLADGLPDGRDVHLETFGGCMLGQLCPPGLLVALSTLEAMFFAQLGIRSVSLSYAQQTHPGQDVEAMLALRRLAGQYLPGVDHHVVVYTWMGVYPRTPDGARAALRESARLAAAAGAGRLIVKTVTEADRIPTIAENVDALRVAADEIIAWRAGQRSSRAARDEADSETYEEAAHLVEAVLALHPRVGTAILRAFHRGLLDVPYCLHPDNRNQARAFIDTDGRLRWSRTGAMPVPVGLSTATRREVTSAQLLRMLAHNVRRFDRLTPLEEVAA
jgi:methylaspartate mutase epsilon subunit